MKFLHYVKMLNDIDQTRQIFDGHPIALNPKKWIQGRVYLNQNDYNANGLAGLFELAQFSYLPIGLILKNSIGRLIANRNIYEMLTRDFVIPDNNSHERTY